MDIRDVPVNDLVLDPNLNLRDRLDDFTVERYAEAWDRMPPVTVFEVDGRWLLADGFHRHAAAVKLGRRTMPAEIRSGTFADALDFVAGRQPVPRPPAHPGRAPAGGRGEAPAPSRLVRSPALRGAGGEPGADRQDPQDADRRRADCRPRQPGSGPTARRTRRPACPKDPNEHLPRGKAIAQQDDPRDRGGREVGPRPLG